MAPSVLSGLPLDGDAQWAARLEGLREPDDCMFGAFAPAGRLQACAQLHWRRTLERTRHIARLTQLIAQDTASGREALGRLLAGVLAFAGDGLAVRRMEVVLDSPARWMTASLAEAGFRLEAVSPGRAAVGGLPSEQWLHAHIDRRVMPRPQAPPLPRPSDKPRAAARATLEVRIRPATELDAEDVAAIYAARGTARGTLQSPWVSADVWRERLAAQKAQAGRLLLVAEVEGNGESMLVGSAGMVTVSDDPRESHVASLGLGVHDRWQGLGVGRRLMDALLDHADHWAHYSRVELQVYVDNEPARRLYTSLGFVEEGVIRDSAMRDGGYVDSVLMARLRQSGAEETRERAASGTKRKAHRSAATETFRQRQARERQRSAARQPATDEDG